MNVNAISRMDRERKLSGAGACAAYPDVSGLITRGLLSLPRASWPIQ